MRNVVVVSAVRTAIGSIGGTLKNVQPETLLSVALEAAVERAGIGKEDVDEVICGQARPHVGQDDWVPPEAIDAFCHLLRKH